MCLAACEVLLGFWPSVLTGFASSSIAQALLP